ncbi:serine hydrolase [Nocardia testacea]|uniref:serine hydrolase n=1 Tax=Nocardia testacea TaxID=248551 RepID=UPI001C3F20AB|nr:serine hydrolase [Nocardia testacea]
MSVRTVLRAVERELHNAGLSGSFLVRDLDTGDELGMEVDKEWPIASLVKVPLVLATLERVERSELDPADSIQVSPGKIVTPGPTGVSKFKHPAIIALDDLIYLCIAISDNGAADALFGLTSPSSVTTEMRRLRIDGIVVRHLMRDLMETPAENSDVVKPTLLTNSRSQQQRSVTAIRFRNWT